MFRGDFMCSLLQIGLNVTGSYCKSFTVFETPLKRLIFKTRSCRVLFSFYYTALNAFENDLFNSFIATVSCGPVKISLRDFISAILTTDFLPIIFYFQSKVNRYLYISIYIHIYAFNLNLNHFIAPFSI